MKTIISIFIGLIIPLCMSAQPVIDTSTEYSIDNDGCKTELSLPQYMGYEHFKTSEGVMIYAPAYNRNNADEQTVTVTFVYDYDANKATPLGITAYNKEQGVIVVDKSGKEATFTCQMPAGTYDMHAMFKGKPTGTYVVFKENVEITDGITITFVKDEANVPLTFKFFDENSTPLTLDQYENGAVAVAGNVNSYRSYTFFSLKGMGVVHTIIGGPYRIKGYDVDYYFNAISNRFTLLHTANMRSKINNATYFFKFDTPLTASATISSKPEDLQCYKQKFVPTPEGDKNANAHIYGCRVWCTYDGKWLLSSKSENKNMVLPNNETVLYIDLPEHENGGFNVMVNPMMGDVYAEANNQYHHIIGLPVAGNSKTGLHFIDYGYDVTDGFIVPVGGGTPVVYPGNPALSWKLYGASSQYIYGNSCPLLSVKSKDYNGKSTKLLTYLGRYGEVYEADRKTVVKNENADGDFKTHTFTQENIKVDDMAGKNVTVVRHKAKGDDITAPSIQMLRFITSDGQITDRIDDAGSGMLEFVAGDMQYHHDDNSANMRYYDCKPINSVEVSYSEHGADSWTTLQANIVPENFFMPGFGYFYRASLASVNGKEKWYDLRIKLDDAIGNTHTQTLMPAFFVKGNTSGLDEIDKSECNDIIYFDGRIIFSQPVSVAIYSLDGRCVKTSYATVVETAEMFGGIYIVKAITDDGHVFFKKITI